VEDSNTDRFFFSRTIARINQGDNVSYFVSKSDLEQAMKEGGLPELLVLDLDVPGCDGMKLLEGLRTDAAYDNLPIVVYTGRNSDTTRREAMKKGATRYVVKAGDPRTETQEIRFFVDSARRVTAR